MFLHHAHAFSVHASNVHSWTAALDLGAHTVGASVAFVFAHAVTPLGVGHVAHSHTHVEFVTVPGHLVFTHGGRVTFDSTLASSKLVAITDPFSINRHFAGSRIHGGGLTGWAILPGFAPNHGL